MLYKKVRIKNDTNNEHGICEVVTRTQDRECNTMYAVENNEGYLLEELFYPSELIEVE